MEILKDTETFDEVTMHLLRDEVPSEYIRTKASGQEFDRYPFTLLLKLKNTEQSKKYHPEGNVWNHTMLVLDEAAKVKKESSDPAVFMWAALLHDIGKPDTTVMRRGRLTSYDHDRVGAQLSRRFLQELTTDMDFIEKVADLVRYHMHILYIQKNLPYADTANLLRKVDIYDIALLCRCDRLGRTGAEKDKEEKEYQEFLQRLVKMSERKNNKIY